VLLYSDGITERRTADGRFGQDGIVATARELTDGSAVALVGAIEQTVLAASEDPVSDDATQLVLGVRRYGETTPSRFRRDGQRSDPAPADTGSSNP
jgi:serine phosphatase RsbU (regulator of sigma subunit)